MIRLGYLSLLKNFLFDIELGEQIKTVHTGERPFREALF